MATSSSLFLGARLGPWNLGGFPSFPAGCRLERSFRSHANQSCGYVLIVHHRSGVFWGFGVFTSRAPRSHSRSTAWRTAAEDDDDDVDRPMRESDGRWLAAELIKSGRTGARAMEACGGGGAADDEEWRGRDGGVGRVSLPRRVFPVRVWCCKGAPRDGIPCHTIVEVEPSIISPEILSPLSLVVAARERIKIKFVCFPWGLGSVSPPCPSQSFDPQALSLSRLGPGLRG
jgi:hypothetical protein